MHPNECQDFLVETYGVRLLCGIVKPLSETHAVRLYMRLHSLIEY